jgi:hypothetical protein
MVTEEQNVSFSAPGRTTKIYIGSQQSLEQVRFLLDNGIRNQVLFAFFSILVCTQDTFGMHANVWVSAIREQLVHEFRADKVFIAAKDVTFTLQWTRAG